MSLAILPSAIHGVGLFSLTSISKNEKITDYIGEEMTLKEFKERYGSYKENCLNTYRMKRLNRIIVAKNYPENVVNYINESKEPNCILKKRALYAVRDICAGEELTISYPKDYKRDWFV